jgi:hypothetical protein
MIKKSGEKWARATYEFGVPGAVAVAAGDGLDSASVHFLKFIK